MKPSIVIVGSSNTDMVIKADHLPAPGETILGGTFFMTQGGKGANQAVAAARLNGQVTFVAKIGADVFGKQSVQLYKDDGIDTSYITTDENSPSGVALITVDNNGENCITVAPGANGTLSVDDISNAQAVFENASIILMQLEIPLETVEYVANLAKAANTKLVLNPAPARTLSDELLSKVSIITPNKKEAEMLTGIKISGIDSAKEAAKILAGKGIETAIVTMGPEGALIFHNNAFEVVPAVKVKASDTTAAGDVFNGALVVALSEGKEMIQAVRFANAAAAISVTRLGAQASAPRRSEAEAGSEGVN
ncbi:MAG: Ribokinase [uncultured Segetibacter sp.]|uniref:Ribokinase n=1 Tax=uncultured Segetibacter sp. TaxID=481133 RepID=A0A6J4RVQ4_9BACT|nr:MAG: Ribokinase [uncultured Segetibacter sp.]